MLRLLQKKFRADPDVIHYALFVVTIHGMLGLIFFGALRENPLRITIKKAHSASHVRVTWTGSKNTEGKAYAGPLAKAAIAEKPIQQAKQKSKKVERVLKPLTLPFDHAQGKLAQDERRRTVPAQVISRFSTINLGPKKKKKKPVVVKHVKPVVSPVPIVPAPVTPVAVEPVEEEPVILSVHEHQQEQELLEIIDAVRRWWQPPLGVAAGALCAIKVKVSQEGAVQEVIVEQSSGVPAYDIAAKSALLKSIFPKKVWGKECVFQF